jgi:hypothetical protein
MGKDLKINETIFKDLLTRQIEALRANPLVAGVDVITWEQVSHMEEIENGKHNGLDSWSRRTPIRNQ